MPNATDDEERSNWAETLPSFGPDTQIYEGEVSRAILAQLLGGRPAANEKEVTRRLRGRPSLTPARRGEPSRQLHVRIGSQLSTQVDQHIAAAAAKNESELVRAALSEYFERHQASA